MKLNSLVPILTTFMPIVKIDNANAYLLGTEVKQMQKMSGGRIMVTVGGGFVTIQEYYEKHSIKQCVKLYSLLKRNNFSLLQGIIHLLESRSAAQEVIRSYKAQKATEWSSANDTFMQLAGYVQKKFSLRSAKRAANLMYQKQKAKRESNAFLSPLPKRAAMRTSSSLAVASHSRSLDKRGSYMNF